MIVGTPELLLREAKMVPRDPPELSAPELPGLPPEPPNSPAPAPASLSRTRARTPPLIATPLEDAAQTPSRTAARAPAPSASTAGAEGFGGQLRCGAGLTREYKWKSGANAMPVHQIEGAPGLVSPPRPRDPLSLYRKIYICIYIRSHFGSSVQRWTLAAEVVP